MTIILNDAFNRFIRKKRLKNCSEKTIKNYTEMLAPFLEFLGANIDVSGITTDVVLDYIDTLFSRKLADASRATYIRHIRTFLRWLKDCYDIPVALTEIELPKTRKKIVRLLTDDEIKLLFNNITCQTEWLRLRNCSIVALMLGSGLRQNEVTTLQWKNMYFNENYAVVRGKGDKERCVPLGSTTIQYLMQYKSLCPYENEFVFVERRGAPITNNAIKLLVQKIKKRTGIDFSSHKLRHNFATNFCKDSLEATGQCDAFTLQVIMGHEDIKTTEKYMHYASSMIASKNARSHLDAVFGV